MHQLKRVVIFPFLSKGKCDDPTQRIVYKINGIQKYFFPSRREAKMHCLIWAFAIHVNVSSKFLLCVICLTLHVFASGSSILHQ